MTIDEINKYIQERNIVLEKRDVGSLIAFMDKYSKKGVFPVSQVEQLKKANLQTQMIMLCKMICNVPTLSKETIMWARTRLKDLGTRPTLY